MTEGFFAIEREQFHKACSLGINEACFYLVYARGTSKDNRTTNWSKNALNKYIGISRSNCKKAEHSLQKNHLTLISGPIRRPEIKIVQSEEPTLVWLPNLLVDRHTGLRRLRETRDPLLIRLLIDIYAETNLAEYVGVPHTAFSEHWKKKRIANHGAFTVYGFHSSERFVGDASLDFFSSGDNWEEVERLWERIAILESLGMVKSCPVLFDHEDGESYLPLLDPFDEEEDEYDTLITDKLPEEYDGAIAEMDFAVAVPSHIQQVTLKTVYRPTVLQDTSATAFGYATIKGLIESYKNAIGKR